MQDGPYGITCPTCSQKLRVRQTSVFIASTVILFAPMLFVALVIEPYTQYFRGNDVLTIASVVVVIAPLFWIQTKYAKRFAGLRDLDAGEVVSFPLEAAPFDPFAYEFEKNDGPATFRPTHENTQGESETWRCSSCGEANPVEFELCWKCGKDRPDKNVAA
jgi:hypothetical protein